MVSNNRPNILLFFPDQFRGDWTEMNPDIPVRTPNLKLMASQGIHFSNAICPSPLCAPSRSCFATGKEYDHCNIMDNDQNHPLNEIMFYRILRDRGYHTMGCGKFDLNKPMNGWGRDGKQVNKDISYLNEWGFSDGIDNGGKHQGLTNYRKHKNEVDPYFTYLEERGVVDIHVQDFVNRPYGKIEPTNLSDEDYADNWIARNGLKLIDQAPKNKPWFLQINFNGPHSPMDVTVKMRNKWKNVKFPLPNNCTRFTEERSLGIRQNYAAMLENIDSWIKVYEDFLRDRDELDNTIIVFSSDHGEMLGDHDLITKMVPYDPSVHVPLFIKGPGIKHRESVKHPVGIIDLAPTFVNIAGGIILKSMDAHPLNAFLSGDSNELPSYVRSGLHGWRLIIQNQYKLIQGYNIFKSKYPKKRSKKINKKPIVLFDTDADPWENQDISKENKEIVKDLRKILV
jgi:arylsulfatase